MTGIILLGISLVLILISNFLCRQRAERFKVAYECEKKYSDEMRKLNSELLSQLDVFKDSSAWHWEKRKELSDNIERLLRENEDLAGALALEREKVQALRIRNNG